MISREELGKLVYIVHMDDFGKHVIFSAVLKTLNIVANEFMEVISSCKIGSPPYYCYIPEQIFRTLEDATAECERLNNVEKDASI